MDGLEETLDRLLSDPKEMEKLSRMAAELFGGTASDSGAAGGKEPGLGPLQGLLGNAGGGDKAALLKALSPYLEPKRREKLKKAMGLAKAARLAGLALREFGGEDGV